MNIIIAGTNHKYSPIEVREKISFSKKRLTDALLFLKGLGVFNGAVILSTCNRVEIYASAENPSKGIRDIGYFISRYHEINERQLSSYLYKYEGKDALRHLSRVAAGLDSLILGETQILGQVKSSLLEAETVGFVDELLRDVFYSAISIAKKIHAETRLSKGRASIGSVAIDFIKEKVGNLSDKKILIIGTGKVTELVLKHLKEQNPTMVFVSNRTFEKAKYLASQVGASAVRFDELKQLLGDADIIITATRSPHFIIRKDTLEKSIRHKLLIIDLALPRDVDPEISELKNVELYSLEDLDATIDKNRDSKLKEAIKAKKIIDLETEKLWKEITELEPGPVSLR